MSGSADTISKDMPKAGAKLNEYLADRIRECVAHVIQSSAEDVDVMAAFSGLGIDSIVTVPLKNNLQQSLGAKVPSTLIWNYPTVIYLVSWYTEKLEEEYIL